MVVVGQSRNNLDIAALDGARLDLDTLCGRAGLAARAVVFLTADDAGYITGINLPVNGGLLMGF